MPLSFPPQKPGRFAEAGDLLGRVFEVVRQRGGTPNRDVTKRTKILIVGELGWPLRDDGRPSNKLTRASEYGIPVVNERRFLEWIGKAVPDDAQKSVHDDNHRAK
jgi:hypothetical protein